jgi:hypothetical protein
VDEFGLVNHLLRFKIAMERFESVGMKIVGQATNNNWAIMAFSF